MRCLASWGAVKEVGEHDYAPTTVSTTFANTRNEAAMELTINVLSSGWMKLPQHLKDLKYKNPTNDRDSALAKSVNAMGRTVFEIIFDSPM
jgi:hypothetical protein